MTLREISIVGLSGFYVSAGLFLIGLYLRRKERMAETDDAPQSTTAQRLSYGVGSLAMYDDRHAKMNDDTVCIDLEHRMIARELADLEYQSELYWRAERKEV